MTSFHIDKAEFAGAALEYATKNMPLVESYLAHWFRENTREIMPSIKNIPRRKKGKISGGFVHPAPVGFYRNVIEFDNKMQYPALIISCNLDTTTLLDDDYDGPYSTMPSGRKYRLDPEGTMPAILRDLVLAREEIQAREEECELAGDEQGKLTCKNQNRVFKFFMNSFYGVLASGTTEKTRGRPMRLADHRIGEDVTTGAVEVLKYNKKFIENLEYELEFNELIIPIRFEVLYQDTDSCKTIVKDMEEITEKYGVIFDEDLLKKIGAEVAELLNESYSAFAKNVFNTENHAFFIKVDSVAEKYYQWGKKKHYVYSDFDGKITYKGFKIKRSDSTFLEKMFWRNFFEDLMNDKPLNEIGKMVKEFEDKIKDGTYRWETGKSIGIRTESHWAWPSAEWSNRYLGKRFKVGESRPVIYYVKAVKNVPVQPPFTSGKERRVALDRGDDPKKYGLILDVKTIISKYLNNEAAKNILSGLNTSYSNLRDGGMVQQTWADFE
jgi:DNA polymerase elongation subunit (family B)